MSNLTNIPEDPPSLYIDIEGPQLGRHGSISLITLYLAPANEIYLIDIHVLGPAAFSTTNANAASLKTILESATIPKVFFDIRNDSDALFSLYQISVDGIRDLQLMELATRKGPFDLVVGLAKCIENDSVAPSAVKAEWRRTKEAGGRLFNPDKGGRYEVFNERPLKPEIVQYCARDVALLPGLWNVYNAKLCRPEDAFWRSQVRKATTDRIRSSQSQDYDGQSKSKVCGPWDEWNIEQDRDDWNDDVMMAVREGIVLNKDDIWVDPLKE